MATLRSQRGLAAAVFILLIVLGLVALILGRGVRQTGADLERRDLTAAAMAKISRALIEFAALNRRLPCPARGDLDTGDADPATSATSCTADAGVVPWKALALRREDAVDGWGRKISYRVFSGTTGFTQAEGVNMSNCNTSLDPPLDSALGSGATCPDAGTSNCCKSASAVTFTPAVPPNTPTQWLTARGNMLVVNDLGTTRNGNAFVLISHGATGLGAYLAEGGTRMTLPNASGTEYLNTQSGGTYSMLAQSESTIAASDAAHFDDLVTYKSFTDLMQDVKLSQRAWGNPFATSTFSATTVDAAVAAAGGSTSTFNTGLQSVDFGTYTVSAYGSSARNVGFDRTTGTGIGSIGTGSNSQSASTINEATSEGLTFTFDTPGRYLGITLSSFGGSSTDRERVRFRFLVNGVFLISISRTSCKNEGIVNYTLNPGGDFTEVQVEARTTATFGNSSSFRVDAIASCPSTNSSCKAPNADSANDC